MNGITIIGTGHHVPGNPVLNEALARVMDTSDEWIRSRTGIRQRYFAEDGQGPSDLALPACKSALHNAQIDASDVDYIIFATMTPDHFFPGSGALLGSKLGIHGVPALDIPQMRGPSLLKKAVQTLSRTVRSICETRGISQADIDCFIPHQANDRINQAVRDALKIPPDKIPSNIARFGNTSAATIGILTDELRREGRIREGDLLCFLGIGAGLNWGVALMRL